MVVRLTSVIRVAMAMMMTIIAAAAAAAAAPAAAADGNCRCRWGGEEYGVEEMCLCVFLRKHLGVLATLRGKDPVIGHPCSRAHSPAADPLISGNKEGRVSNSSKIASGVGGVEGCSGGVREGRRGREGGR